MLKVGDGIQIVMAMDSHNHLKPGIRKFVYLFKNAQLYWAEQTGIAVLRDFIIRPTINTENGEGYSAGN